MAIGTEDFPWISKVLYAIGAAFVGIVTGSITVGYKLNKFVMDNEKRDVRLEELKQWQRDRESFCTKQQQEIGKSLCESVKHMIAESKADTNDDITEIKINVAVLVERHKSTEELKTMMMVFLDRREEEIPVRRERRKERLEAEGEG